MRPDIDKFRIPSPSSEGIQIMEMLSEVDVDMSILSDIISRDPVLAATVMKYANSPLYRRIVEVNSVKNAVSLLGLKNVATAILIATMRGFATPPNNASETIWEHSMGVASLCRIIARKTFRSLADKVEFIATMHDIGALFMAANLDKEYEAVLTRATADGVNLHELETQAFGFDHDVATPRAISKLQLPEEFSKIIIHFHVRRPLTELETESDQIMAILSLAHYLEAGVHGNTRCIESMPESRETLCSLLNLSDDDIADITDEFEDILSRGF